MVLYYATSSLFAIVQQRYVLSRSEAEMEKIASSRLFRRKNSKRTKREHDTQEAIIVRKKDLPAKDDKVTGGKTVVRRIKAK